MHEIVEARYPAPAAYVPRGGRHVQGALVSRSTPVRIPKADHRAFVPVPDTDRGWIRDRHSYRSHEGALWLPLSAGAADGPWARERMGRPADFLAWLGDPDAPLAGGYIHAFGGTPLLGVWGERLDPFRTGNANLRLKAGERVHSSRGRPPEALDGAREVRWDGGDAARAALLRFMEEDVRLTRHRVYVRVRPLVLARAGKMDVWAERFWMDSHLPGDGYPIVPGRAGVAGRRWSGDGAAGDKAAGILAARLGAAAFGDADVDLMANWLPALAMGTLNRLGSSNGLDRALWEMARDRVEPVRASALSGTIGGNGGEGRERHLAAAREALLALAEAYGPRVESGPLRRAVAYLDDEIIPRAAWRADAPDAGDIDALAPLAP